MAERPSFFVIAGPTAVGKSDIAVEVAEACNGEIVGADAFQIYEELEILTAQPSPELRRRVPHHLIGNVPVSQSFDVAQFRDSALERLDDVRARGRVPIVCGGTGLYLRALMRGLADLPPANADLRAQLETQPLENLQRQLTALDPASVSILDFKNPRRVIRAIEICLLTGRPFSSFRTQWHQEHLNASAGVVLTRPRAELTARIAQRTREMFSEGVEGEVRALGNVGPTAENAIGLREITALLAGKVSREECIASIEVATRQYAKRQTTWFRQEPSLIATDLSAITDRKALVAHLADHAKRTVAM